MHLIEQGARLMQVVRRRQRALSAGEVVTVIMVCAVAMGEVRGGELVEHLTQRPHACHQVTEHGVRVGRIVEDATGVRETAQRF
ncbi:hypothetical protein [Microlunatus parietis]|uniref:Uncharacterized protein n=1 Tax=Microlunatus parietis TaxID=682979 RepID=A0A7Y9I8D2_9ACTN|nr:hypothetical protein [Microlunatus parietis]NYE72097.1 hypothetical protein [Microlunatus parietis]